MHVHHFSLLVIYILVLICTIILCFICGMKIYQLVYGSYGKEYILPKHRLSSESSSPFRNGNLLDPRVIKTRIKFLRRPYKKMKESHQRNMPPIVEVSTPADSDTGPMELEESLEGSNEQVIVCPEKEGGRTNYWKRDTIIIVQ